MNIKNEFFCSLRAIVIGLVLGFVNYGGAATDGEFILDGTMVEARSGQDSAVVLDDGRVFFAGGLNESGVAVSSTEIYDPATGLFTVGPTMAESRRSPIVAKLNDGRVFVAGGYNASKAHTSAQIYDPATNSFSWVTGLPEARHSASVITLQDGRILLYGGFKLNSVNTANWLSGVHHVAHIYDPATDSYQEIWMPHHEALNPTQTPVAAQYCMVWNNAILLADGRVLISGGLVDTYIPSASMYFFDPATNSFAGAASMSTSRLGHAAVQLADGRVMLAGGQMIGGNVTDTCDLFDPTSNTIVSTLQMTQARVGHRATQLENGEVLITGPQSPGAEMFDPDTGVFTVPTGQPNILRSGGIAVRLADGAVFYGSGTIAGAPPTSDSAVQAEIFIP